MIGSVVKFTDENGVAHDALVTRCWNAGNEPWTAYAINLVYVSTDESQEDQYGRQIVRKTSVPPKASQSAPGFYYE